MNSNYICVIVTFIIKLSDVIFKSAEALCVAVDGTFKDGA
jgi:hypothetical protein